MDKTAVAEKIKQDQAVLEASLTSEKKSDEDIKSSFEALIKSLSQQLVLELKDIQAANENSSKEDLEALQKQEVDKFQAKVVEIAHYIDSKLEE